MYTFWYYPRIRRIRFWSLYLSKKSATYTRVYTVFTVLVSAKARNCLAKIMQYYKFKWIWLMSYASTLCMPYL